MNAVSSNPNIHQEAVLMETISQIPADYPSSFTGTGQVRILGQTCPYQVICEDFPIAYADGRVIASVFSYSYRLPGTERPVLFIFNGGPGSPSTWLQMGFLGPRLAAPDEHGMPRAGAPYALRDNPDCLLDLCDLVFYNPPGAGYSRLFHVQDEPLVFGDHADADAAAVFIRSWLRKYGEKRPIYLLGESFGSTRASLLAYRLSDLPLKGVLHVGPGITGEETIPRSIKDLIPCSATRWFHDASPDKPSLQEALAPVRQFLYHEYFPSLCIGSMLSNSEYHHCAEKLAAYTGLPADYFLTHDLKLNRADFRNMILAEKGLKVGSFDTRFTLPLDADGDPTLARFDPAMSASARLYDKELGLSLVRPFRENSFDASSAFLWPFNAEEDMEGLGGNWYPMLMTVAESVRLAYESNPTLRFFFATGLYDTVATVENTRFAVSHTHVPLDHVELHEYESGHAVYADETSRHQLALDIRHFMTEDHHEPA